jgi:predicted cobalt transporter CbtA
MLRALVSGVAGAVAVTAVHETARRTIPQAPRMDVIGRRGIAKSMYALGTEPPHGQRLQNAALAGDVVSNSLYYSLIGLGSDSPRATWKRGLLLGVAAGIGAVLLPPVLGLGRQPGSRGPFTHLLTVAWYTIGGLAAAASLRAFQEDN